MPNDIAKLRRLMRTSHLIQHKHLAAQDNQSFALKMAWWFENLRNALANGFARFTYRKKDGTLRTALGTRSPSLIPTDKLPKGDMSDGATLEDENIKNIPYFDLDKNEWRSFGVLHFVSLDNDWTFNDPLTTTRALEPAKPFETVKCEYCDKVLPKSEATYYEDADIYVCPECAEEYLTTCDRCGAVISRDDSYITPWGKLCDCCHGDMCG